MNILIYLGIAIICIASIYYANKLLGKLGLTITFIVMSTVSFILTFKYVTLSTINLNSNCFPFVTMLTSLYLLLETTSKKETKEIVNLNFIVNIFTAVMLYIMINYTQILIDTISVNMKNVFDANSRILLVYPLTTLLSNYLSIWTYEKIKKLYDNHFISIVTIYLLVGIVEGIIYTFLCYQNILNTKTIILILLSSYMIRLIITVIYSLFLIIISKKKVIS